ncbi:MAG: TonB-dependent receptor [Saprospiraceae bacterium]|nr:TonB-dependent receptor [Saprospiraceae bacterium]
MKKFCTALLLMFYFNMSWAQNLTQTVRGTIFDSDTELPLIGASVILADSEPLIGTTTDALGVFRLENIPVGRVTLQLSYLGYESTTIPNVVVNSGKEVVLQLRMQESAVRMTEVVVTVDRNKGEAVNDMAMISARSISAEETNRYAGGFNDPSRIMSNFAGITSTQDGSNDIIVRGNSPKYVQWRLEGVQITNPNHFADPGAVSGAVSTLNNNLLATSDFYTGAFTPEFGDVLSGVYDVKLRAGNNEKFESVFGFGLLGTDITFEGPFKKGYGGSFLVNYRYSTASIISDLGLIDIDGVPNFQDAAFKFVLPTKKAGTFSMFGLGGISRFLFEDITPDIWETPGDRFMQAEIAEDFKKRAHLLNTGLNHTISLDRRSFLRTSLAFSQEGIDDDVFESNRIQILNGEGQVLRDSFVNRRLNWQNRLKKSTYRAAITYNNKLNARNKIQIGTKYALFDFNSQQSRLDDEGEGRISLLDFQENISTVRNFISWKHRIDDRLSFVTGVHNMNVLFNNQSTLEPRLAVNWQLSPSSSIQAGYGLHSNMESIHNYFAKVQGADGSFSEPNRDLGLLKAHHYVIGYEQRFGKNMRAKVEVYYQDLYDLPVENNDTSFYSTINEGLDLKFVDLVNEGTGKNYGVEITVEKFFSNNYYYLINASVFESKYTALDGIERNTQFNGNYLINILLGKEFTGRGRKQNQTLGLNAKVFFGGARKIIPLLRDSNGQLAVDPDNSRFWDYSRAYQNGIEDVYQVVLSASYKWNKPKTTHELFLNLDNVTNNKGKISEYYDEAEPDNIGYLTQFGFFPNLMYRVYF